MMLRGGGAGDVMRGWSRSCNEGVGRSCYEGAEQVM